MPYPKNYFDIYRADYSNDSLHDLEPSQVEMPIDDITFCERISLDSRYGISSDVMLPSENQDESEIKDWRVRSDHDIRVSLMDQIEMRTNQDARSKSILFNPNDYSDYADSPDKPNLDTPNAND